MRSTPLPRRGTLSIFTRGHPDPKLRHCKLLCLLKTILKNSKSINRFVKSCSIWSGRDLSLFCVSCHIKICPKRSHLKNFRSFGPNLFKSQPKVMKNEQNCNSAGQNVQLFCHFSSKRNVFPSGLPYLMVYDIITDILSLWRLWTNLMTLPFFNPFCSF